MRKREIRVLVIRPDRIGDVVLSTPIPREIRKKFPESYIAVLVRRYTQDIYLHNPHVNEVLLLDDESFAPRPFWDLVKDLRQRRITHAFMLLPNERINYSLFCAGIRHRFGVGHKLYQFITGAHSVPRHKYIPLRHEVDYCLDMVRKIGVEPEYMNPEIHLTERENAQRNAIRKSLCPENQILIGVHATHGYSSANMRPSEYRRLVGMMVHLKNARVVVTDCDPPDDLKNIEGVDYPNVGKPLRESIVQFAALDCLVSASTGPMHIAAALQVKTVSVFCPYSTSSPQLWGPLGNTSEIVFPEENYHGVVCSGHPRHCHFEGTGGIDAIRVFDRVKKFLSL